MSELFILNVCINIKYKITIGLFFCQHFVMCIVYFAAAMRSVGDSPFVLEKPA